MSIVPVTATTIAHEAAGDRIFTGHPVTLPIFEGPLDLLLFLIERQEIDIYDIPIATITAQYLDYLVMLEAFDVEVAADFLVMAATLIEIKSRMLLPREEQPEAEQAEEGVDPRAELVARLLEYKQYKDVSLLLKERQAEQAHVFTRLLSEGENGHDNFVLVGLSGDHLWAAFQQALARVERAGPQQIIKPRYSMREKMALIMRRVLSNGDGLNFLTLFEDDRTKLEVIVTLLALLELIRLHRVRVRQRQSFGEIMIYRNGHH